MKDHAFLDIPQPLQQMLRVFQGFLHQDVEVVSDVITSIDDWDDFIDCLSQHNLLNQFKYYLELFPDLKIPRHEISQDISALVIENKKTALINLAEMFFVCKKLREHDIEFCVLKGAPLSYLLFGDATLRNATDIDILVAKKNVFQVDSLLKDFQFVRTDPKNEIKPYQAKYYLRYKKDFIYMRKAKLELHWALFTKSSFKLKTQHFFESKKCIILHKQTIDIFRHEEYFLYLCLHGSQHGYSKLFWLMDVAEYWRHFGNEINHDYLMKLAERFSVVKPLIYSCMLAHNFFGINITGHVKHHYSLSPVVQKAIALTIENLSLNIEEHEFEKRSLKIRRLLIDSRIRLAKIYFHKITDISAEFEDFKLPGFLYPLYFLLRPFLIKKRRVKKSKSWQ